MLIILSYLLPLFVSIMIYWLLPKKWRSVFLLICNIFFIASFSIKYLVYFLFNIGLVYIGSNLIRQGSSKKKLTLKLLLVWLIGNLCFFKYINLFLNSISTIGVRLSLFPELHLPEILLPLGISYIIFRLIHYIVEVYRKNVPRSSFVDFALYVLFFPTFLAGPVDRFQRFHPQTAKQQNIDVSNINYGLYRILFGLVKKFIVADNLAKIIMPILNSPQSYSKAVVILSIYTLYIRIYMDFSGYTDLALGVARLFGYKIMENFNRPYLKKNIVLFWRNWHISVYSWIRDYFFFPVFGSRASRAKLYRGLFISMLVFHLWHEASIGFLILGVYHGAGLVIYQLFQETKKRYPFLQKAVPQKVTDPISTFFTFSYVSLGFIFFGNNLQFSLNIIKRIFM